MSDRHGAPAASAATPPSAARQALAWFDAHVERVLMIASYAYFCSIIFIEIVLRYFFGKSTGWGEMTARYAFVLLASVALAEAARSRGHIRIDILPSRLSGWPRFALYAYFDVLQVALGILVAYYGITLMQLQLQTHQLMQSLDVNMAFAYAALPLGWSLFIMRVLRRLAADWRAMRVHGEVPLGGEGIEA